MALRTKCLPREFFFFFFDQTVESNRKKSHALPKLHLVPPVRTISGGSCQAVLVLSGHSWGSVNIWVVLMHVMRAKLLLNSSSNSSARCSL